MRKLIATILCLAMVLVLGVPAVMAAGTADANDIVILYTNDVHTYIDGPLSYDVIAALKTELKKQYDNVLLVDATSRVLPTAPWTRARPSSSS